MFSLPKKKNLLGLYGEEPRELFTARKVEVQAVNKEENVSIKEAAT